MPYKVAVVSTAQSTIYECSRRRLRIKIKERDMSIYIDLPLPFCLWLHPFWVWLLFVRNQSFFFLSNCYFYCYLFTCHFSFVCLACLAYMVLKRNFSTFCKSLYRFWCCQNCVQNNDKFYFNFFMNETETTISRAPVSIVLMLMCAFFSHSTLFACILWNKSIHVPVQKWDRYQMWIDVHLLNDRRPMLCLRSHNETRRFRECQKPYSSPRYALCE